MCSLSCFISICLIHIWCFILFMSRPPTTCCPATLSKSRFHYLPLRWEELMVYWSLNNIMASSAPLHANHFNKSVSKLHDNRDFTISITANIYHSLYESWLFCRVCCLLSVSNWLKLQIGHIPISVGIHTTAFPNALWPNYYDSSWDNTANNSFSLTHSFFLVHSVLYWTNTHRLSRRDNGHRPVLGFE